MDFQRPSYHDTANVPQQSQQNSHFLQHHHGPQPQQHRHPSRSFQEVGVALPQFAGSGPQFQLQRHPVRPAGQWGDPCSPIPAFHGHLRSTTLGPDYNANHLFYANSRAVFPATEHRPHLRSHSHRHPNQHFGHFQSAHPNVSPNPHFGEPLTSTSVHHREAPGVQWFGPSPPHPQLHYGHGQPQEQHNNYHQQHHYHYGPQHHYGPQEQQHNFHQQQPNQQQQATHQLQRQHRTFPNKQQQPQASPCRTTSGVGGAVSQYPSSDNAAQQARSHSGPLLTESGWSGRTVGHSQASSFSTPTGSSSTGANDAALQPPGEEQTGTRSRKGTGGPRASKNRNLAKTRAEQEKTGIKDSLVFRPIKATEKETLMRQEKERLEKEMVEQISEACPEWSEVTIFMPPHLYSRTKVTLNQSLKVYQQHPQDLSDVACDRAVRDVFYCLRHVFETTKLTATVVFVNYSFNNYLVNLDKMTRGEADKRKDCPKKEKSPPATNDKPRPDDDVVDSSFPADLLAAPSPATAAAARLTIGSSEGETAENSLGPSERLVGTVADNFIVANATSSEAATDQPPKSDVCQSSFTVSDDIFKLAFSTERTNEAGSLTTASSGLQESECCSKSRVPDLKARKILEEQSGLEGTPDGCSPSASQEQALPQAHARHWASDDGQSLRPFFLPDDLGTEHRRGDFDFLIVSQAVGCIAIEVKAVGYAASRAEPGLADEPNDVPQTAPKDVQKKLAQAVRQLNKEEAVLRHLFSDVMLEGETSEESSAKGPDVREAGNAHPGQAQFASVDAFQGRKLPVTKVLALPNIARKELIQSLEGDTNLKREICECLRTRSVNDAVQEILCEDDIRTWKPKSTETNSEDDDPLLKWWTLIVNKAKGDKSTAEGEGPTARVSYPWTGLSRTAWERIVGRLGSRYSRVTVEGVKGAAEARTAADCVHLTGLRYGRDLLRGDQLRLLDDPDPFVLLTGPPGSGKTLVLGLKGVEWARRGDHVVVFVPQGTGWGSRISETLYRRVCDYSGRNHAVHESCVQRNEKKRKKKKNGGGGSATTPQTKRSKARCHTRSTAVKDEAAAGNVPDSEEAEERRIEGGPPEVTNVHKLSISKSQDVEEVLDNMLNKFSDRPVRFLIDEGPWRLRNVLAPIKAVLHNLHHVGQVLNDLLQQLTAAVNESGSYQRRPDETPSFGWAEECSSDKAQQLKVQFEKIQNHVTDIRQRFAVLKPPNQRPLITQTAEWVATIDAVISAHTKIDSLVWQVNEILAHCLTVVPSDWCPSSTCSASPLSCMRIASRGEHPAEPPGSKAKQPAKLADPETDHAAGPTNRKTENPTRQEGANTEHPAKPGSAETNGTGREDFGSCQASEPDVCGPHRALKEHKTINGSDNDPSETPRSCPTRSANLPEADLAARPPEHRLGNVRQETKDSRQEEIKESTDRLHSALPEAQQPQRDVSEQHQQSTRGLLVLSAACVLSRVEDELLQVSGKLFNIEQQLDFYVIDDVCKCLRKAHREGKDLSAWTSGVFSFFQPEDFVVKSLTRCLRCPPTVQAVLAMVEKDMVKRPYYEYQDNSLLDDRYPLPSDGPEVKLLDHRGHLSEVKDILDCKQCGHNLSDFLLLTLQIGKQNKLKLEDVSISGSFELNLALDQRNLFQVLAGQGMQLQYDLINVVPPPPYPDKVLVIGGSSFQGLESKVVVFIPDVGRISGDTSDLIQFRPELPDWLRTMGRWNRSHLWFVASRCLSQLVVFHV